MCSVVTHGGFGYLSTNNTKSYGYYIVNFNSNTYNLHENFIIDATKIDMVEQVTNDYYPRHMIQGYKWYAEPLNGKTHNTVVAMITVFHPQLDIDVVDSLYKIWTHICSWKV